MEESNLPEATSGGDIASQPTQADADEASKKRKRDEPEAGTNTRQNDEDDEPPLVVSAKKPKNFDETPTVATVEPTEPKVEMQPEPPAPKKKEKPGIDEEGKKKVFKFGNYLGYYGYRLDEKGQDPRIAVMKPEWFDGKEVLDIGCNSGVFTLQIACHFNVKRVEGRDIDSHLIDLAVKTRDSWYEQHYKLPEGQQRKDLKKLVTFKVENFVGDYFKEQQAPSAPMVPPGYNSSSSSSSSGPTLQTGKPFISSLPTIRRQATFDTVTCMSVTKWIHLNWGDEGIQLAFKRMQQLVRVGGYLIIEIQDWNSYRKKKDMTETTADHYSKIKLRPHQFTGILEQKYYFKFICEIVPENAVSKGFSRPISVFQRV